MTTILLGLFSFLVITLIGLFLAPFVVFAVALIYYFGIMLIVGLVEIVSIIVKGIYGIFRGWYVVSR